MSDDLLKNIECNNYIISTSGCHNHPNKEVFSRILKYQNNINILFNYKNEKMENLFSQDELNDYGILQKYLCENNYTIEVL
jgi:hypothetical protein